MVVEAPEQAPLVVNWGGATPALVVAARRSLRRDLVHRVGALVSAP
jgi:hypothetical protein